MEIHPEARSLLDHNWSGDNSIVLGLSPLGVSKPRVALDLDWTQILAGIRQCYISLVDRVAFDVYYAVLVVYLRLEKKILTYTDIAFRRKGVVDNHNRRKALLH